MLAGLKSAFVWLRGFTKKHSDIEIGYVVLFGLETLHAGNLRSVCRIIQAKLELWYCTNYYRCKIVSNNS